MKNYLFVTYLAIALLPLAFWFFDRAEFRDRIDYKFLVKPLSRGAVWAILFLAAIDAGRITAANAFLILGFATVWHYAVIFTLKAFKILGFAFANESDDVHRRGQGMHNARDVVAMIKSRGDQGRFSWGGIPIPRSLEDRSFLLAGSPGSGKSQAICAALDAIKGSADRAIITDPSAQFLRRYRDEKSLILNPLDTRSQPWSPFAEFTEDTYELDARTIASSLVPVAEGSADEWNAFVRGFLRDIQIRLWETDQATNERLNFYARIAGQEELFALLEGTPSLANLQGNDKLLGSIRTTGDRYLDPLSLLNPDAGKDSFSVRKWTLTGEGWLFLTYAQNRRLTLAPLMGAQINVFADAMLTRKISKDRAAGERVWGVFDEFPLLGRVSSIEQLLSNGSKHSFAGLIGIQTVAQLRATYGRETAQTILACLGSWLVLRCNDAETAQYMATHAGKEEVLRTNKSSGSPDSGEQWSQAVTTQDVLLPSELQNLPDLQGFLNLVGEYPICPLVLAIVKEVADRCNDFEGRRGGYAAAKPIQAQTQDQTVAQPGWELD